MPETRLGEIDRDGEAVVLRYQRHLQHPPTKVWRAITVSEHLRHWFPADIIGDRVAGAELKVAFWPESIERAGAEIEAAGIDLDDAVLPGRLLTWDPPRVFEFTWDSELLRFDLAAEAGGTRLTLTVRATEPGPRGYASTAAGYHLCVDALVAHVDDATPHTIDRGRVEKLETAYASRS